jgi:hypothetical protein
VASGHGGWPAFDEGCGRVCLGIRRGVAGDGGRVMPAVQVSARSARTSSKALRYWARHGQLSARWRVVRRAERVTCPGMSRNLRRSVWVVTIRLDS